MIRDGKDKLAAWESAAAKYPSLGRSLFLRAAADTQEPPSPPSPEDEERARRRFEEKGRFSDYLAEIPTFVIRHPEPAFVGLASLLDHASD